MRERQEQPVAGRRLLRRGKAVVGSEEEATGTEAAAKAAAAMEAAATVAARAEAEVTGAGRGEAAPQP